MSYVSSAAFQAKWWDAALGSGRAANMPATVQVHIYTDDPGNGGTELASDGGYAALTVNNDDTTFPPADATTGEKTSATFSWTFTGPTSDIGTWLVISDGAGMLMYDGPTDALCNPGASGGTFTDAMSAVFPDTP